MNKYFMKSKKLFWANVIVSPMDTSLEIFLAYLMGAVIDIANSKDAKNVKLVIIVAIAYIIAVAAVTQFNRTLRNKLLVNIQTDIREDIMSGLLGSGAHNYAKVNSSSYSSNMTTDVQILVDSYFRSILYMYTGILQFAIATTLLFFVSWKIGLFIAFFSLLQLLIPAFLGRILEKKRNRLSEVTEFYIVKMQEIFGAFSLIKAYNLRTIMQGIHHEEVHHLKTAKYKSKFVSDAINTLSTALGNMMYLGTFVFGAVLVIQGELTVGSIIIASQLMVYIANPLIELSGDLSEVKSSKGIISKIQLLFQARNSENEKMQVHKLTLDSGIKVKDLSYTYPESDREILKNINIELKKNRKYIFVGKSGSGKSTFANLVSGLLGDFTGDILLDSLGVNSIAESDLYKLITVNQQFPFIFDDSLRNNITLYSDYPDSEVLDVLKKVGLEEWFLAMDGGLDVKIGQNAARISGGEKQRISVARALLRKAPILILDESTSNLDQTTAYNIEQMIMNLEGVMAILISHRLEKSILQLADEIVMFEQGQIIEQGNFNELMEKREFFYSLYTLNGTL